MFLLKIFALLFLKRYEDNKTEKAIKEQDEKWYSVKSDNWHKNNN